MARRYGRTSPFKNPTAQGFVTGSNFQSTSTNLAVITGLTIPILANERWAFLCEMVFQNDTTANGVKFGVNGPTGATVEGIYLGLGTGTSNTKHDRLTALHTQSTNYSTVATTPGGMKIAGSMLADGSHSGNLDIEGKITTDGTLTVFIGAWLLGWRLA